MRFLIETLVEKSFMVFEVISAKSNNKDADGNDSGSEIKNISVGLMPSTIDCQYK
jgi:hypothetical protein